MSAVPEAVVRKRRAPSLVWVIPIVAAAIGGWLWIQSVRERGPAITIEFNTAEGLEAGKTHIKLRSLAVGEVEELHLKPDLTGVVVTARVRREVANLLTDSTRFWVVRPRLGATEISGLSTLISGAYIEMDGSATGRPTRAFVGLESPPVSPADAPGLKLLLEADDLGSLGVGSGVYFRDLVIGEVESFRLADDGGRVLIDVYVDEPYAQLVRTNTRFWNAGGIDVQFGASGLKVTTGTLAALVAGGVGFHVPQDEKPGPPAASGASYQLYADRSAAEEKFSISVPFVLYFHGSARGLEPGSPVELRGLRAGTVRDVRIFRIADTFWVRAEIDLNPARLIAKLDVPLPRSAETTRERVAELIELGLRGRLATTNLITGGIYVGLDIHEGAPPAELVGQDDGELIEIPTIPSAADTLADTLKDLSAVVADLRSLVASLDRSTPGIVVELRGTLEVLRLTLAELSKSLRSVRGLTDLLERHPEALIQGKPEGDR